MEKPQLPADQLSPQHKPPRARRKWALAQVKQALLALPNLAKLLARLAAHPQVPVREKVILAATVAYLAIPLDIIPDAIPILGEVDDLFLVALVLQRLISTAGEQVVLDNWDGDPAVLDLIRKTLDATTILLPKRIRDLLVGRVNA
jgi:uncharacterized membrane protein YkvA (DUF1232 family)